MLGTFYVTSAVETVFLFGIAGFGRAVTSRVPYSLLGDELSRVPSHGDDEDMSNSQGLIYGFHNVVICVPQILIMSLMRTVWLSTEEKVGSLGVVWFLRLSGLSALIAMGFATMLDERVGYGEGVKPMLCAVSTIDSK
jgi:solute carrier family 45, member 1/2/4